MDTLALNPNQIEAYVVLIHIALAQKNIPEARRLLRLVERVNADTSTCCWRKAPCCRPKATLTGRCKHFTRASEINPSNPLALSSLGMLYLGKDMPAFAEQALKRAYALAPGNVVMLRALCRASSSRSNSRRPKAPPMKSSCTRRTTRTACSCAASCAPAAGIWPAASRMPAPCAPRIRTMTAS